MGALEAPLSSESWFGDWLAFDLLFHLPPLLTGQQEVHMLGGDVFTEGVLVDTEIYGNLEEEMGFRITAKVMGNIYRVKIYKEPSMEKNFDTSQMGWNMQSFRGTSEYEDITQALVGHRGHCFNK